MNTQALPHRRRGRPFAKGFDPRRKDPREAGKLGGRPRGDPERRAHLRQIAAYFRNIGQSVAKQAAKLGKEEISE